MTPFQRWEWGHEYDDACVACSPDGLNWSADMAYYAGKPARPSCHQSFAEFLREGVPDDYDSIPQKMIDELREAVDLALLRQPPEGSAKG
jgi:hypothetical protein